MKKRLALVVNSLSGGGAERTVSNLSRGLAERYDVDIVVNDEEHIDYPYEGQIISLKMPSTKARTSTAYQIKALVKRTRLLKKLKKERNYAAVVSFSELTNLSNVLSRTENTKTILSVRNSVRNSSASSWKYLFIVNIVFPFCFKKADKTVACSKEIADELVQNCGLEKKKSYVIYNGLDLLEIKENLSKPLNEPICRENEKLIVTVGRLAKQKGQWHLIRVIKKLKEEGLPVKLIIVGEGSLQKELEKLVFEAGLKDAVVFSGFVKNPHQYMATADVVVFPSLYEGFSNTIAEALACGAPVISTDHETGAREILAPETDYRAKVHDRIEEAQYGLLVPVCDGIFRRADEPLTEEEQLMADAIRRMVTDSKWNEHYREAAPKRAEQLAIQTIAEEWIRVIENG